MDQIKLLVKQTIFNIKNIISNKINLLLMLSFVIFAIMIPIIFIPFLECVGLVHILVLLPVSSVVFSYINYNVRHSTLNANLGLTKSNRWSFYLSTLLTMLIFTILMSAIVDLILIILNEFNLLLVSWMTMPNSNPVPNKIIFVFNIQILTMYLYCAILLTLVVFGISFALQHLIKDSKTYFVIIFSLLILCVIFGGTFNRYFWPYVDGEIMLDHPLFPKEIYWFSAIFPFFSIGSLYRETFAVFTMKYSDILEVVESQDKYFWFISHTSVFGLLWINNCWQWNLLMATPWIEIVLFFIAGSFISKISRR